MEFIKPISDFNINPENYILKIQKNNRGEPSISYTRKNLFTWIAVKILHLENYDLNGIANFIQKNQSDLDGITREKQTIDDFYYNLNTKIRHYDSKHTKHKIGIQFARAHSPIENPQDRPPPPIIPVEQPSHTTPPITPARISSNTKSAITALRLHEPIEINLRMQPASIANLLKNNLIPSPLGVERYFDTKEKLLALSGIQVSFDDQNYTIKLKHNEQEIYAIFQAVDAHCLVNNITIARDNLTVAFHSDFEINELANDREKFLERELDLLQNAEKFLSSLPKKQIPTTNLTENNPQSAIHHFLDAYEGICFGEAHHDPAPKKFLIENMEKFKEEGVTTLYLEHLFLDSMQPTVDAYFADPAAEMSPFLETYLQRLDHNLMKTNYSPEYNYTNLVKSAKKAGIRVVAADTHISYASGFSDKTGINNLEKRVLAMNAVAAGIVKETQENQANPGKYLMLLGSAHIAGTHDTSSIPGVAEILGIPAIIVETGAKESIIEYNVKDYLTQIPHLTACILQKL